MHDDPKVMPRVRFVGGMNKTPNKPSLSKKVFHFEQRIGEQPVNDYYKNMKELIRSVQREEHLKEPQTAYLVQCEKQNLVPDPFGLVSRKGNEEELNLQSYRMGNSYAKAYGQGLKLANIKRVNVADNGLNDGGSVALVKGINPNMRELDLSSNRVGAATIDHMCS
jgi:hypothetical protein